MYEYDNVLPRAAVYYDAVVEKDERDVLRKLPDPALDVFRTVVLDASKLSEGQAAAVTSLNQSTVQRVDAAVIKSYRSQAVEIEASLKRRGILVLNDSDYPVGSFYQWAAGRMVHSELHVSRRFAGTRYASRDVRVLSSKRLPGCCDQSFDLRFPGWFRAYSRQVSKSRPQSAVHSCESAKTPSTPSVG